MSERANSQPSLIYNVTMPSDGSHNYDKMFSDPCRQESQIDNSYKVERLSNVVKSKVILCSYHIQLVNKYCQI